MTSQRQQLAAIDAQRRAALRAVEDSMATAGARLDDRAKEEKLRQIRLAEEAYQVGAALLCGTYCSRCISICLHCAYSHAQVQRH